MTDVTQTDTTATELETAATHVAQMSAAQREAHAATMARKADTSDAINYTVERAFLSKEENAMAPINLYLAFVSEYGAQEMAQWPLIGTSEEAGDDNPDTYKRPTRRKGGGVGTANETWSTVFADNLKVVRETVIAYIDKAKEDKAAGRIGEMVYDQIEAKFNARLSSARTAVKAAIALFQNEMQIAQYPTADKPSVSFEIVQEEMPDLDDAGNPVVVDGVTQTHLEPASTAKPICLVNLRNPKKDFNYLSVQQFNSLDFDEARAKGGTYDALLATMRRAPQDADTDYPVASTLEALKSSVNSTASSLDALFSEVVKALEKKDAEAGELALALNRIYVQSANAIGRHAKWIEALEATQKAAAA